MVNGIILTKTESNLKESLLNKEETNTTTIKINGERVIGTLFEVNDKLYISDQEGVITEKKDDIKKMAVPMMTTTISII